MIQLYAYRTGEYFAVVKNNLKIGRTKNLQKASYWVGKKNAKSWKSSMNLSFTNVELIKVGLALIEDIEK